MDVPGRVGHDDCELAERWHWEGANVAVHKLGVRGGGELYVMKDLRRFFSLDATSGLLATASASAPAMFLALRSALVCVCT